MNWKLENRSSFGDGAHHPVVNHDVLHLVRLLHALLGQQGLAAGEFPHQLGERLLRLPLEVGVDGDDYLLQGLVVVVGGLQQGSVAFGTAVLSVALVRRLVRPAVLFWVSSDVDAIAECGGVDDGEGDGAFLQHPHPPVVVHLVQLHELELVAVRDALDLDPLLRLDVPVHCLLPPLPAAVPRLPPLLRLPEGLPTHRRPVVDAQFVGTLLQVDALVLVVDHSADVEGDPAGGGVETAVSLVGGDAEGTVFLRFIAQIQCTTPYVRQLRLGRRCGWISGAGGGEGKQNQQPHDSGEPVGPVAHFRGLRRQHPRHPGAHAAILEEGRLRGGRKSPHQGAERTRAVGRLHQAGHGPPPRGAGAGSAGGLRGQAAELQQGVHWAAVGVHGVVPAADADDRRGEPQRGGTAEEHAERAAAHEGEGDLPAAEPARNGAPHVEAEELPPGAPHPGQDPPPVRAGTGGLERGPPGQDRAGGGQPEEQAREGEGAAQQAHPDPAGGHQQRVAPAEDSPAAEVQPHPQGAQGQPGEGVPVLPAGVQDQGRSLLLQVRRRPQRLLTFSLKQLMTRNGLAEWEKGKGRGSLFGGVLGEVDFEGGLADFEGEDGAADLHALLAAGEVEGEARLLHQGAELGLVVEDEVVAAHPGDAGVAAGDGDVGHSDFALVAAADPHALLLDVLQQHHVVGLVGDAFQHEVVSLRLVDGQQFVLLPVLLDEARVLGPADFAVELLEVVLRGAAHHFLLHLRTVPLLQTAEVHQRAGPAAAARRAQEPSRLLQLSQHAVLALHSRPALHRLRHDALLVHPEPGTVGGLRSLMLRRSDQVLQSAQFDDVAGA